MGCLSDYSIIVRDLPNLTMISLQPPITSKHKVSNIPWHHPVEETKNDGWRKWSTDSTLTWTVGNVQAHQGTVSRSQSNWNHSGEIFRRFRVATLSETRWQWNLKPRGRHVSRTWRITPSSRAQQQCAYWGLTWTSVICCLVLCLVNWLKYYCYLARQKEGRVLHPSVYANIAYLADLKS